MLSDSFIALSTLLLAALFLMGYDAIWLLFVVSAFRSLGSGIQSPAISAILPQIVPQEKLTRVNAANGSIQSLVLLVSPMLSGALLTIASIEAIFFIDVATAALAVAILLLFLHVPLHRKAQEGEKTGYFNDMKEGVKYIVSHRYLRAFFLFSTVYFFMIAPAAFLTPLQVTRSFGSEVWRLTAVEVAFSAGITAGGLFMASWGGFKNRIHTMMFSSFMIGAGTIALGLVPGFTAYLAVMALVGIAVPFFNTPATVMLQRKVEQDFMGRVFGVMSMITGSMMPLGMLVFGPVADIVRIEWLLAGTGIILFLEGFFLIGSKSLAEAGKPDPA
jgi:DHA3 family macrolide efflux protein-like MFS transporter